MAYRFLARVAEGDDGSDDYTRVASVAEAAAEGGFLLMFMSTLDEDDEDDAALGFDTHCVVTPDQGTAYGCVREAVRDGDVLRVVLDPASLGALGLTDPVVEAELRAPAEDVERMLTVLAKVLAFGRPEARPTRVEL